MANNWNSIDYGITQEDIDEYMIQWDNMVDFQICGDPESAENIKARKNKIYQLRKGNLDLSFKVWYANRLEYKAALKSAETYRNLFKNQEESNKRIREKLKGLDNKAKPEMVDASTQVCRVDGKLVHGHKS